jgi:hypothetical protein
MSKRNLILLIIALVVIAIVIFGYLYSRKPANAPIGDNGGTNFFSDLNPFGKSVSTTPKTTPSADISGYIPPSSEIQNGKLKKVSSMPIAGFGIFTKEKLKDVPTAVPEVITAPDATTPKAVAKPKPPLTEFMPAVRYVARATGNIYQTFADKIEERKFSTTMIPRVYEAYFGNKGESVIMRYLKIDNKTIVTFVGALPKELLGIDMAGNNEISGSFLPDSVSDVSISPDTLKIFYLFNTGNNVIGTTADGLGGKKVQVFDSPFTEWLSFWPNTKMITLTTKPSWDTPGYMYAVDPNKKDLNKVLGDIKGLTTLTSPNGGLVLYGNNTLSLNVYHTDTRSLDALGVKTLPEKCIWGKVSDVVYCAVPKLIDFGLYPDSWYKGEVSFSDAIWKIDIKSGNATLIADPDLIAGGEEIDGTKLALDDGENYLFFVNKKDSSLWELNLK